MDRRSFLNAAGAAGWMIVRPESVRGTQANSAIGIGVVGCGGRGTAVASGFARNTNARVVALADLFQDRLDAALANLSQAGAATDAPGVFRGPKAFQELVNARGVDMVLITSPPYFHPEHLEAAVAAGKHVYLEKPVAVDVPGCRRVLAAGRRAEGKLSLDVGFQLRMAPPFVELVKRVHGGAIGEIVCAEAHYNAAFISLRDFPQASAAERRLRHWVHDRILSGDILVEQNIHSIDICNWVLRGHPLKAVGTGGRKGRNEEGTAWSHFALTYYYPNDVHVSFSSTQFGNKITSDVNERFFGTRGKAQTPYTGPVRIEGEEPWSWQGASNNNIGAAEEEKERAFIESITAGRFHNQAAEAVQSTLACIMGRMAAYTGKPVSWEQTLQSKETWNPKLNLDALGG
jgi:predicted dehydrogenase